MSDIEQKLEAAITRIDELEKLVAATKSRVDVMGQEIRSLHNEMRDRPTGREVRTLLSHAGIRGPRIG